MKVFCFPLNFSEKRHYLASCSVTFALFSIVSMKTRYLRLVYGFMKRDLDHLHKTDIRRWISVTLTFLCMNDVLHIVMRDCHA